MTTQLASLPPVKIPLYVDTVISLLREEIKSRALTRSLDEMEDPDAPGWHSKQACFILSLVGFLKIPEETLELFSSQLDYYATKAQGVDDKTLSDLAFSFYIDLEIEKRS